MVKRRPKTSLTFSVVRRAPRVRPRAFPERTLVMSKKITTTTPPEENNNKEQGWHTNTDLGCEVKTILRSDVRMKTGKEYQGVLRLDSEGIVDEFLYRDPHYTFVETVPPAAEKRNLRVFRGKFITVTRKDDGTYRPNFRPLKVDEHFSLERYAFGVYRELHQALEGLVEK